MFFLSNILYYICSMRGNNYSVYINSENMEYIEGLKAKNPKKFALSTYIKGLIDRDRERNSKSSEDKIIEDFNNGRKHS